MSEHTEQHQLTALSPDPPAGCRIIVVDDEPMVTASIATMLALETDYEAETYNHPVQALEALKSGAAPDLVISDFLMPDMDGLAFLQAVRTQFPETTLILLTGYADKENAIQAINDVGIYRYLEKPWDNEALKLAIRNGLERTHLLKRLGEKITALEQAQGELREYSEHLESKVTEKTYDLSLTLDKLRAVVENTGDGILTVHPDGRIQRANHTFGQWAKRFPELLDNQPLGDYLVFDKGESMTGILAVENEPKLFEVHINGTPVELNVSRLPAREGFVLVCRDIAKRKEAERLREDFVSTLTHDLRVPLLAAIQTLGFLQDGSFGDIPDKHREIFEMMSGSHQQMLALVNDLLDVYRYEARQQKLVMQDLNMDGLIKTVVEELRPLAQAKSQTLDAESELQPAEVWGDKYALRRVLTNLIGNAIHYTPSGGKIIVRTHREENQIQVHVQDNGRGIPPHDLIKLFERFAQGTSKHRTTGTGLGLYLSRQIIEAHDGRIWADSVEGQGSTFSFELPVPHQS